ncbi:MAG: hypothetical protein AB2L14_34635 [Candidatus Xenobiia bacterium LiM19]
MNTIGQTKIPDPLPQRDSAAPVQQENAGTSAEVKDQVTVSSGKAEQKDRLSFLKNIVGVAGGTAEAIINAPAGFVGGLVEGVDESGGSTPMKIATVLELASLGAVGGSAAFGLPGAIGGAVAGVVAGMVRLGVHHESGAAEKMEQKLEKSVKKAVSDNVPSGKKSRDMAKNATEGAILGTIIEGREGFKTGFDEGRGIVSGLIEGTKGVAGVITGKISPQKPAETAAPEAKAEGSTFKKVAGAILSLPKKAVALTIGLVSGTVGAAISAPVGLIQGIGEGATKEFEGASNSFNKFHRFMGFMECAATGAVTGFVMGGPVGLGIGLGGGIIAGGIVYRIERKSGADKEIVGNISSTLEQAAKDNPDTGSKVHDITRNTVEGAIVGTASGVKEGFKKGFDGGVGVVDGFVEGVKGIFGAVTDIAGKK